MGTQEGLLGLVGRKGPLKPQLACLRWGHRPSPGGHIGEAKQEG